MVEDPPSTKQEVYPFQLFAFRIFDDVTGCLEHKGIRSDLAQEKDRLTLAVASSTRPFIETNINKQSQIGFTFSLPKNKTQSS